MSEMQETDAGAQFAGPIALVMVQWDPTATGAIAESAPLMAAVIQAIGEDSILTAHPLKDQDGAMLLVRRSDELRSILAGLQETHKISCTVYDLEQQYWDFPHGNWRGGIGRLGALL